MMTDGNMANPLKVSIALGQKPAIIQKGPFYLMKPEQIVMSEVTGATNLMASKNLEHSFQKLAAKKMKDSLSSFLPGLPGIIDTSAGQDNSSLRQLIEINVEVIEENRPEEEPEEEDEEYSIDSEDSESDLDLAVFVEIVGERGEGNQ